MIAHCVDCQHEDQRVKNEDPCGWCGGAMHSIGDDYMSDKDDSITSHSQMSVPVDDFELPLDFILGGVNSPLRAK